MELFMRRKHSFSSQHAFLGLLVCLVVLTSPASSVCNNLKILRGNDEVTDQICIEEYLTNECLSFSETFNVSLLPEGDMGGDSVQRPAKLDAVASLSHFSKDKKVYQIPAIKLDWLLPSSGGAKKDIKGFYIWVQSDDKAQTECRIFSIDNVGIDDKLEFHHDFVLYDLDKISEKDVLARNYTVRIYALPLPMRNIKEWMNNIENFKSQLVTTRAPVISESVSKKTRRGHTGIHRRAAGQNPVYPAEWTTGISVSTRLNERAVIVLFNLPDPSLNFTFTNYTVGLVDMTTDPNNPIKGGEKSVFIPSNSKATEHTVKFTGLSETSWYQVYVRPIDLYRNVRGKCQCYVEENSWVGGVEKQCRNVCRFTRSSLFNLEGETSTSLPPPATTQAPSRLPTDDPSLSPSTNSPNSTNSKKLVASADDDDTLVLVISVSVGVVAFVIVIIVVIYFVLQHRGKERTLYPPPGVFPPDGQGTFGPLQPSSPKRQPSLRRKTIFLMSSPDHSHHQSLLKQFVYFLKTYCKCEVVEPSEAEANQHNGGKASWLVDKLTKCDFILFFNSHGAFCRLKAFVEGKEYRPVEMGPQGDVFNLGLSYMFKEIGNNHLGKMAGIVSLTGESCKTLFLGELNEYVLPKYMSPFLQQLHNFGPEQVNTYKSQLPMMPDHLPSLPGVSDLLESIKAVEKFEKENPHWFSTHFELIETKPPKIERFVSNTDSSYGSLLSTQRSVTPPPGSTPNSSPISVDLARPNFPTDSDNFDSESCRTVNTSCLDPDQEIEFESSQRSDFQLSDGHGRQSEEHYTFAARKKVLTPPINKSDIKNIESISTAIGGFNENFNQKNPSRKVNETPNKSIVPPCNQSQINNIENLSVAIGNQNQNLNHPTSIKPPISDKDIHLQQSQVSEFKNKNNQMIVSPPRDVLPSDNASNTFSQYLTNANSNFKNNVSGPFSSKDITERLDEQQSRIGNEQIRLPVGVIPSEIIDNFSQVLDHDINSDFRRTSHSSSEDATDKNTPEKFSKSNGKIHKPICPPVSHISSEGADNLSEALKRMNPNSTHCFVSSRQDSELAATAAVSNTDGKSDGDDKRRNDNQNNNNIENRKTIRPPIHDFSCQDMDNVSDALQNINAKSKDGFSTLFV